MKMSRKLIAIDGASRRNGKEDCIAAGGIFIIEYSSTSIVECHTVTTYEIGSTNQRGEMLALEKALDFVDDTTTILTDSEYLLNSISKEWVQRWKANGWVTQEGNPVANKDLWERIYDKYELLDPYKDSGLLHIKGHLMPFGKVTAARMLSIDLTGQNLFNGCLEKYDKLTEGKLEALTEKAHESSIRNHSVKYGPNKLRLFTCANLVADAVATSCVEAADSLYKS